jgi:peptide deformylase
MSILEIVEFPANVLKEDAKPIEGLNSEIEKLARDMVHTMYHAPGSGLAANQVGVTKQLFVADISSEDDEDKEASAIIIVNPKIVEMSEETITMAEGCLSVPDFSADVERAAWVKVIGKNMAGEDIEVTADGWLARVFQHEIDHLNGTLYLDHIGRMKRQRYIKKRKKYLNSLKD